MWIKKYRYFGVAKWEKVLFRVEISHLKALF
jgi:hypothetical protein